MRAEPASIETFLPSDPGQLLIRYVLEFDLGIPTSSSTSASRRREEENGRAWLSGARRAGPRKALRACLLNMMANERSAEC